MDNSYEVPELVSVNNKRFNWYTKEFEDITDDSPIGIAYLGETDNYRYNDKYDIMDDLDNLLHTNMWD